MVVPSVHHSSAALRTCARFWGTAYSRASLFSGFTCRNSELHSFSGLPSFRALTADGLFRQNCGCLNNTTTLRFYSAAKQKPRSDNALQESQSRGGAITLSTAEKVKENVKTASYGGVIIVGVIIGGAMLYYVLNELLSSESPNNIYTHSFKLCKLSMEVQDALGTPIKCYGEETRRGWRKHVAFQEFLAGDTKFIRMRFYVEGTFKKGTVNVEKKTNERGKYEYTYLIVDVDGYPSRRIDVPF